MMLCKLSLYICIIHVNDLQSPKDRSCKRNGYEYDPKSFTLAHETLTLFKTFITFKTKYPN